MRRRTIYITIGVIVIIIIAVAAYWFFSVRPGASGTAGNITGLLPPVSTNGSGGSAAEGTGPSAGINAGSGSVGVISAGSVAAGNVKHFGLISNEPTLAYFDNAQNDVTIVEPSGKIANILNGQPTFLNSTAIQNVISAEFSFDGKKVLVNFGDPIDPQTSIFDVANKSWMPLPAGILSPVWSPSEDRIAYLMADRSGAQTLFTLDTANSKAKPLALSPIQMLDASLAWPNKNNIVIADKPSSYENGSVLVFNVANKTFSQPFKGGMGLDIIWSNSTSSDALIFTAGAAERGGSLSLWDPANNTLTGLTFLTLPPKCTFNSEQPSAATSTTSTAAAPYLVFYCAVPEDQNALSGQALPDAYYEQSFFTIDHFFKVNADSGALQNLFTPPIAVDAIDLKVFNNILFFVNRYDQKLYALSLGS